MCDKVAIHLGTLFFLSNLPNMPSLLLWHLELDT